VNSFEFRWDAPAADFEKMVSQPYRGDRIWGYRSSVGLLGSAIIRMLDSAKLQGWIGLSHVNVQKR